MDIEDQIKNLALPKGKLNSVHVTIRVNLANSFQQETHVKSLALMLHAWRVHVENAHQKNSVDLMQVDFNQ